VPSAQVVWQQPILQTFRVPLHELKMASATTFPQVKSYEIAFKLLCIITYPYYLQVLVYYLPVVRYGA
jgi:hypothetical protein